MSVQFFSGDFMVVYIYWSNASNALIVATVVTLTIKEHKMTVKHISKMTRRQSRYIRPVPTKSAFTWLLF